MGRHAITLGEKVEDVFSQRDSSLMGWKRAIANWRQLEKAMNGEGVSPSLAPLLNSSWAIISEWISGDLQEPELTAAIQDWISGIETESTWPPQAADVASKLAVASQYYDAPPCLRLSDSIYHAKLFDCFRAEFFNHQFLELGMMELQEDALYTIRSAALQHAAARRLASSLCMASQNMAASHLPGRSSILESAPWIERGRKEEELPYFLWDIAAKRTVVVNQLNIVPSYTCISHTWGRWRKEPSVTVKGVEDWEVPQNTKFRVQDLPQIFADLEWNTPYLWFDLFCIPQDGSLKALEEISRQAKIFSHCSQSIAWLNDIPSWDGTQKAVDWLLANYLLSTSTLHITRNSGLVEKHAARARIRVELLKPRSLLEKSGNLLREKVLRRNEEVELLTHAGPVGWFTSLWTLQESFLCPHMTLVDAFWRPLTSSGGAIIALDNLVSLIDLVNAFDKAAPPQADRTELAWISWPKGPKQLAAFGILTDLKHILLPSRTAALVLGNRRQCSESRAEAIMSVAGATQWYERHVAQYHKPPPENDLLLGTYPLPFAQEAAEKMGGRFYTCLIPGQRFESAKREIGSMLPFTSPNNVQGIPFLGADMFIEYIEDHPALGAWTIERSAAVRIKEAGILGSSSRGCRQAVEVELICRKEGRWDFERVNLQEWLGQQQRTEQVIFVSLYRTLANQMGIILQVVSIHSEMRGYLELIKVGLFKSRYRDFPPTEEVDWKVL